MDLVASALGLVGKINLKQWIKIKWTVVKEIKVVFILLFGPNLTKNKSLSWNVRSEMSTKCANYI